MELPSLWNPTAEPVAVWRMPENAWLERGDSSAEPILVFGRATRLSVANYKTPLPRRTRRKIFLDRSAAAPLHPKLVTMSNAFLTVVDPRAIPDRDSEPARFGAWAENACLSHAWNVGQQVSYWREKLLEVDAVLEALWGGRAIELNTGTIGKAVLRGLAELAVRNRDYQPLVLCETSFRMGFGRSNGSQSWRRELLEEIINRRTPSLDLHRDFAWSISADSATYPPPKT